MGYDVLFNLKRSKRSSEAKLMTKIGGEEIRIRKLRKHETAEETPRNHHRCFHPSTDQKINLNSNYNYNISLYMYT